MTSAVFQFWLFDFVFLVFKINIWSFSVAYISICFGFLCVLTTAVFHFCIFDFLFVVSSYWHQQYFVFGYLTLHFKSLHIDICSISVPFIWLFFPCFHKLASAIFYFCIFDLISLSLHSDICIVLVLYILFSLPCLCILTLAVFQFCILLCFCCPWILTGIVFRSFIFYFACLVSANSQIQCFSSVFSNLVSLSLHIGICSISVL